jgi:uncharacterized damage-inducible protein DinB
MNIEEWQSFLDYFDKVHGRTVRVARCIPPGKLEWTYSEGKFTLGDLVRHLAGINRYMYAENAQQLPSRYPGHTRQLAEGLDNVLAYFERCHSESMVIFRRLTPEQFNAKTHTPDGAAITVWKWLRLMVEHEIHHRGQVYLYLAHLGVPTPPLYGLTSEDVLARSEKKNA